MQHVLGVEHFVNEEVRWNEHAAARVCRDMGARVTTHTLLSHLNIPSVSRGDNRRIEVIANGLPLFQGVQLAVDTTLVSPIASSSQPRRRQGVFTGAALAQARRSKELTYPELANAQRCRLIVLAIDMANSAVKRPHSCAA